MSLTPPEPRLSTSALLAAACLALAPGAIASPQYGPEAFLVSPTGGAHDGLGRGVALDGDTLALGAPMVAQLTSTGPGRVEIYRGAGPGWVLENVVVPPNGQIADQFGFKVALDGDTLVVGAPYADHQGSTSGAAYVFARVAGEWQLQQQLFPAGVTDGYTLGSSVAIDGDRLVVCADGGQGRAYAFERVGGVWTETQQIAPGGLSGVAHFGTSLDLDGDRMVIGAPSDDGGGAFSGAVLVFEYGPTGWIETQTMFGPPDTLLGGAVALDGDTIAALTWRWAPVQMHVWRLSATGTWGVEGVFPNSHGTRMGTVDLEGDRIVTAGIDGDAFLFERHAGVWSESAELTPIQGSGGSFQRWIDIDGAQVALGAPTHDLSAEDAGGAYVFHLSGRDVEVVCDSLPGSSGQSAVLGLEGGLGVLANDTAFHVLDATPGSIALLTYGARPARFPFGDGLLCIDPFAGGLYRATTASLDPSGHAQFPLDLTTLIGPGAITSGDSWIFQAWYRDASASGAQFNLTNALRLGFTP